ncbi:MAG: hypothetical protein AB7P61_07580 [Gemmatimonadales bacterium]
MTETEREITDLLTAHRVAHGIEAVEVRPTARRSELMIDGKGVLYVPRVVLHELTGTPEPTEFRGLPVVEAAAIPETPDV